jgi:hypothetical protein
VASMNVDFSFITIFFTNKEQRAKIKPDYRFNIGMLLCKYKE